uniref:Mating type protein 1-2-12 n=12 Tax=Calonectria candelabrum species complex TaxID=2779498 RepID=A0A7S6BFR6_9HYPO|nr:mating type protein 1-2-12 [Calonectria pauciramosa]
MSLNNQLPNYPITTIEYFLNGPALDGFRTQPGGYWNLSENTAETFTASYHCFAPDSNDLTEVKDHQFRPLRTLEDVDQHANNIVYQYKADMFTVPEAVAGAPPSGALDDQPNNLAHALPVEQQPFQETEDHGAMKNSNNPQTQTTGRTRGLPTKADAANMVEMMQDQNFQMMMMQNGNQGHNNGPGDGNWPFFPHMPSAHDYSMGFQPAHAPVSQMAMMNMQPMMQPANFHNMGVQAPMTTHRGQDGIIVPPQGWPSWTHLPEEEVRRIQQSVMGGQAPFS